MSVLTGFLLLNFFTPFVYSGTDKYDSLDDSIFKMIRPLSGNDTTDQKDAILYLTNEEGLRLSNYKAIVKKLMERAIFSSQSPEIGDLAYNLIQERYPITDSKEEQVFQAFQDTATIQQGINQTSKITHSLHPLLQIALMRAARGPDEALQEAAIHSLTRRKQFPSELKEILFQVMIDGNSNPHEVESCWTVLSQMNPEIDGYLLSYATVVILLKEIPDSLRKKMLNDLKEMSPPGGIILDKKYSSIYADVDESALSENKSPHVREAAKWMRDNLFDRNQMLQSYVMTIIGGGDLYRRLDTLRLLEKIDLPDGGITFDSSTEEALLVKALRYNHEKPTISDVIPYIHVTSSIKEIVGQQSAADPNVKKTGKKGDSPSLWNRLIVGCKGEFKGNKGVAVK